MTNIFLNCLSQLSTTENYHEEIEEILINPIYLSNELKFLYVFWIILLLFQLKYYIKAFVI